MRTQSYVSIITILNIIAPILSLVLNFFTFFYFSQTLNVKAKSFLRYNMAFSIAFIAYIYKRTNETGDITRYVYVFKNIDKFPNFLTYFFDAPLWHSLLYVVKIAGLPFSLVSFIVFLTSLLNIFKIYNLLEVKNSKFALEHVFFKFFIFFSWVGLFSSYRNFWAFSFILVAIYYLVNDEKFKGYTLFLMGFLVHPSVIIPIFAYFISKVIQFKRIYILVSFGLSIVFASIISLFRFIDLPLINVVIGAYVEGEWSEFNLNKAVELASVIQAFLFTLFISIVIYFRYIEPKKLDDAFQKYYQFIAFYFCMCICFSNLRTFFMRLILLGFIFFIPLLFEIFRQRQIFKKNIISLTLLIVWFFMFNVSNFNIYNDAYTIGLGFPHNLTQSPLTELLK